MDFTEDGGRPSRHRACTGGRGLIDPVLPPVVEVPEPTPSPGLEPTSDPPERSPSPSVGDDENAILAVLATFERAIETKDVTLYRSTRPNLSAEEQRRVEEGFAAVESQAVTLQVQSIDIVGDRATVTVLRQDMIRFNGLEQTQQSMSTMMFARQGDGWVITEISG